MYTCILHSLALSPCASHTSHTDNLHVCHMLHFLAQSPHASHTDQHEDALHTCTVLLAQLPHMSHSNHTDVLHCTYCTALQAYVSHSQHVHKQCVTLLHTVLLFESLWCYLLPGRVLCLSWHPNDNVLVTGASDSTVRVYNVKSGKNPWNNYCI